jgi:hypothetical protein
MSEQGDIISWDDLPKKLIKQASLPGDMVGAG